MFHLTITIAIVLNTCFLVNLTIDLNPYENHAGLHSIAADKLYVYY